MRKQVMMSEKTALNFYDKYAEGLDNSPDRDLVHLPSRFFDDLISNLERLGYKHRARHLKFLLGWD